MNHFTVVSIFAVVAAVVVVLVAAYFYSRRRRSELLKQHFGPEYDRVLKLEQSAAKAESVLEFREKARETLQINPLSRADRLAFLERWNAVQRQFVDDPPNTLAQADHLLSEIMTARGYPQASFEERAEIVSVDYPVVVQDYRAAHRLVVQQAERQLTTEDLRKGMLHFRSLFDKLLNDTSTDQKTEQKKEARA
jgi:hypothetical protein